MSRLSALVLLCLACGANSPELVDSGDDDETGGGSGMAGSGLPTADAGTGGVPGGVSGSPAGGVFQTGGAATGGTFPAGGTSTGGVFPMGGTNTAGTASGGSPATGGTGIGGTVARGGSAGSVSTGGSAGAAGAPLWSREFTYTGTTVYGTSARYQLKILRQWPDDVCLTAGTDTVPHGETGTTTTSYGQMLRTCLSGVPTTSPNRHAFEVTAIGTGVVGGESFELPAESRMWAATTIVRRITVNSWAPGAVSVRVTWEIRE